MIDSACTEGGCSSRRERPQDSGTPIAIDPPIVAAHLESLIGFIGRDRFNSLKDSADDTPEFYERIADFHREVKCLATKTNVSGVHFKSFDINDAQSDKRFSQIYFSAYALSEEVKRYKKTLIKPQSISGRPNISTTRREPA